MSTEGSLSVYPLWEASRTSLNSLHPRKLTWQWKIHHLKIWRCISYWNMRIFQCHGSFQGCKPKKCCILGSCFFSFKLNREKPCWILQSGRLNGAITSIRRGFLPQWNPFIRPVFRGLMSGRTPSSLDDSTDLTGQPRPDAHPCWCRQNEDAKAEGQRSNSGRSVRGPRALLWYGYPRQELEEPSSTAGRWSISVSHPQSAVMTTAMKTGAHGGRHKGHRRRMDLEEINKMKTALKAWDREGSLFFDLFASSITLRLLKRRKPGMQLGRWLRRRRLMA